MKKRTSVLFLFIIIILYILVFPLRLKGEMSFHPVWSTPVSRDSVDNSSARSYPYQVIDGAGSPVLGYIGDDGNILLKEKIHYRASISEKGFINYSSAGGMLVLQDPSGMVIERCDTGGFPCLDGEWFLIISRDRKGISLYNWEGDVLWDYHFSSIITCLDTNEAGLLVGFLNGNVVYLEKSGRVVFKREHRDKVIYGCSLSSMEGGFAVVSGVAPQMLTLYSFVEDSIDLLWEKPLQEDYRRWRDTGFSDDNRYFYLESSDGVVLYDLLGNRWGDISLPGEFEEGVFSGDGELSIIFSRNSEGSNLRITEFGGDYDIPVTFSAGGDLISLTPFKLIGSVNGQIFRADRRIF